MSKTEYPTVIGDLGLKVHAAALLAVEKPEIAVIVRAGRAITSSFVIADFNFSILISTFLIMQKT
jgi:hypothetical protein